MPSKTAENATFYYISSLLSSRSPVFNQSPKVKAGHMLEASQISAKNSADFFHPTPSCSELDFTLHPELADSLGAKHNYKATCLMRFLPLQRHTRSWFSLILWCIQRDDYLIGLFSCFS
ncbi:hCG27932 [Homo sapiens]|nr:RecName: Full=Uncharacterized protein C9orf38 [Homo sapiens]AAF24038.1 PRO0365 [Homo sapiens]EAW58744.1 hCG27932 [Homo sapiens]